MSEKRRLTTICMFCKTVLSGPERYDEKNVSHGLCAPCWKKHYPEIPLPKRLREGGGAVASICRRLTFLIESAGSGGRGGGSENI